MKNNFLLYNSYKKHLELLTQEQKGNLLDALLEYSESRTIPNLDPIVMMAFSFIKEDMDNNLEKYERVCERNRLNVEKRWAKRVVPKDTRNTSGKSGIPDDTRNTDNDNDNDNDNIDTSAKPSASAVFSYEEFLVFFNTTVRSKHRLEKKSRASFKARVKEGYLEEDFKRAIVNASKDKYLMGENDREARYLTPEYITRSDRLDYWLNQERGKKREAVNILNKF